MYDDATLWQRFCRHYYSSADMGFALDVSRVDFPDDFLPSMQPAAAKAFAAMADLEKGAIANADEGRMVGHYWLRTPDLAPDGLETVITKIIDDVTAFAEKVRTSGQFDNYLLVGIGGSMLGPQFLAQALDNPNVPGKLKPHFLDNTDPAGIDAVLRTLEGKLDRTLVVVTSKSGGTPETRNGMVEVQAAYAKAGVPFAPRAVAVTGEGSKLDKLAESEGWLARFPMHDWVGGRTSVFSAVGLLPLALQGVSFPEFILGAREMDEATRATDVAKNPAMLLAQMWYFLGGGKGSKDMVVLPYNDRLGLFAKYLQQLVMESLGKAQDRAGNTVHQGIAVYGNKGSTDQHSYVQQLRDGLANFFAVLIEVRTCPRTSDEIVEVEPGVTSDDYLNAFLLGTRKALYENGRQSILITVEAVTERSVGQLIALFERAVGFYAELVNINAYHQPGVEAGKKAAGDVLTIQKAVIEKLKPATTPMTAAEIAASIGRPNDAETVFHILTRLAANPRHVRWLDGAEPAAARFQM